jgi:hypothetical protein
MLGNAVAVDDADKLPADAQQNQFIKCVEISSSATVDLSSGSMLFDNIVS